MTKKNFLVSKLWMFKWRNLAIPGPINNVEILCSHYKIQVNRSNIDQLFEKIPGSVFQQLVETHGHHPAGQLITFNSEYLLQPCSPCLEITKFREKRDAERRNFMKLKNWVPFPTNQLFIV